MGHIIFLLFAASLGIGGYALMARASLRSLLPSLVVGVIGTGVYLVSLEFGLPEFASNLFGATIIPGKYLYHTFSHLLADEYMLAWESCLTTFEVSAGIACGLVCGLIIYSLFVSILKPFANLSEKKRINSKE